MQSRDELKFSSVLSSIRHEGFQFDELPDLARDILEKAAKREFGDVPIVRQHIWSKPDWSFVAFRNQVIVGSVNLIIRKGTFDDKQVLIAGVNNLITEPDERKKGVGHSLMREAIEYCFGNRKAQAILLFCADDLVPYYEKLGFTKTTCPVWIDQPTGRKTWASNCLINTKIAMPRHKIDLCGLPW